MAIRDRQQRLDSFLNAPRPGGGSLYGGPPIPPPPAPTKPALDPNGGGDAWERFHALNASLEDSGDDGGGGIGDALKGGLGTVLGGAAKKLDWVANLGMLGAEELSEFVAGEEFESQLNADGTLNEFGKQGNWEKLNDPDYGFGKLVPDFFGDSDDSEWAKWGNRFAGFVGDVALDPITYIGGAAMKSSQVMGKPGREAMVRQAAMMGMSEDVVKHIGKFAHVGLDDATREALGVRKAGVYWGVGEASVYLPLTSKIGKVTEKGFSAVRRNTAGRLVGRVGKGRGDATLVALRRAATTGETVNGPYGPVTPTQAGIALEAIDKFKGVQGRTAEPWARLAQKQFQGQSEDVSRRVTKEIESLNLGWVAGAEVDPAKLAKLSPEARQTMALRDLIYSDVVKGTGKEVDMGFRGPGYLPHRSTKEAWDFFGDDSAVRQLLNGGSLDAGQDAAMTRTFLPGKTVQIKTRPVTFDDASIADINKKLDEAFPEAGGIKFVEDNSVVLMERYISEMSRIQGHWSSLKHLKDAGHVGNIKHLTTEMLEGSLNVTKNAQLKGLLGKELASRREHEVYLSGEAARVGKEISAELDATLVRLTGEAAEKHGTLKKFADGVAKELKDHNKGRPGAEKRIRAKFDAERKRLEVVFEKQLAAKSDLEDSIAALRQQIAEGHIAESVQTRAALDGWIGEVNSIAANMGMASAATEGLTELDEMFGLVMAQAGRMEEIAGSPDELMDLFADLQGFGLVSRKSRLSEEVKVGTWEQHTADDLQKSLDLLDAAGTFDAGWDESLEVIEKVSGSPFLNQARVDSRLHQLEKNLGSVDGRVAAEAERVAGLLGAAREAQGAVGPLPFVDKADVVRQNKLLKTLTSVDRQVAWRKNHITQSRHLGNLRQEVADAHGAVLAAEEIVGSLRASKKSSKVARADLDRLVAARDNLKIEEVALTDEVNFKVLEATTSEGRPGVGLSGPEAYEEKLGNELLEQFEILAKTREDLREVEATIYKSSKSPAMGEWEKADGAQIWITGTDDLSELGKLRKSRFLITQQMDELRRWSPGSAAGDSRALVDMGKLDEVVQAEKSFYPFGGKSAFTQNAAAPPNVGPGVPYGPDLPSYTMNDGFFYGPQRPAPTSPLTYRAGDMRNARVLDRREMVQNIEFLRRQEKRKGTFNRVMSYLDADGGARKLDDGVTVDEKGFLAETVEERVPKVSVRIPDKPSQAAFDELAELAEVWDLPADVVAQYREFGKLTLDSDARKVLRMDHGDALAVVESARLKMNRDVLGGKTGVVSFLKKEVQDAQAVIDDLVDIPDRLSDEVSDLEVRVLRTLLDGLDDGVTEATRSMKVYDDLRRRQFPQTDTASNDKWALNNKVGVPNHLPDLTRHADFRGPYETWSPLRQEEYDYVLQLSKYAHSGRWPSLEAREAWDDLGKLRNGKYDPDTPWDLTWKQTPPWQTDAMSEASLYSPNYAGGATAPKFADSQGAEELTQNVGDLVGYNPDTERVIARTGPDVAGRAVETDMAPDGASARGAGEDLAAQAKIAKSGVEQAEATRNQVLAGLGLDEDMVKAARGPGITNNRDVLLTTHLSFRGKVEWAADGVPTTPRRLASEVAAKFGEDFDSFKAAFPDVKAKSFDKLTYKQSAEALGVFAKKFTFSNNPRSNFMKHTSLTARREQADMIARDILEVMDPEDRHKIFASARSEAMQNRKLAFVQRDAAQAFLNDATFQQTGQRNLGRRLERNAERTLDTMDKFDNQTKYGIPQDAERGPLPQVPGLRALDAAEDDLVRVETALEQLADDAEFGFNKLVQVEQAIGKAEADEMAGLDSVRQALVKSADDARAEADWNKKRLDSVRDVKNRVKKKPAKWQWGENTTPEKMVERLEEFENILKLALVEPDGEQAMKVTARLVDEFNNQLKEIDRFGKQTGLMEETFNKAAAGAGGKEGFNLDMQRAMLDGYERLNSRMFPGMADDSIDSTVKSALENWMGAMRDDLDLKWFDEATQIFKSYATMTPGFHLRNFMGATFMNFSDGVAVKDVRDAHKHWRAYVEDPRGYIARQDDHVQRAFESVFAVGAGGSFDPGEVGTGAGKAWKLVRNNKATRMSRRYGEDLVEGPVRLAAALNSTRRGGGVSTAAQRVKRLHFDYSDLSSFDQKMKRVVPFYMFMSRNLPLQVEQMWRKPKAYAIYNHFMNNFDQSDENTIMPKYLKDAGAIVMGSSWFGDSTKDFVLAPDLQHNNLMQDIMAFSGDGDQGVPILDGVLASGNPIATRVLEAGFNHSGFRGGDIFYDNERDEFGNYSEKSTQQKYLERLLYVAEGVMPPLGTVQGLLGVDLDGGEYGNQKAEDKQLQKGFNSIGLPFKQIGESERDWERRRRKKEDA